MFCKLCMKYGKVHCNGTCKWVKFNAMSLLHDKIRSHKALVIHHDSEQCKLIAAKANLTGGIHGAIEIALL